MTTADFVSLHFPLTPETRHFIGEAELRMMKPTSVLINAARGPVKLLLPLEGISLIDVEGEPFHDPEADTALFDAIRENISEEIKASPNLLVP